MDRGDEKRARIIAEQAAREAADRAAGRVPVLPTNRSKSKGSTRKSPFSRPKTK